MILPKTQKAAAFIEAIRCYNRMYGIEATIPELKETDFEEIAQSIHRECISCPASRIMDDDDVYTLLARLMG